MYANDIVELAKSYDLICTCNRDMSCDFAYVVEVVVYEKGHAFEKNHFCGRIRGVYSESDARRIKRCAL